MPLSDAPSQAQGPRPGTESCLSPALCLFAPRPYSPTLISSPPSLPSSLRPSASSSASRTPRPAFVPVSSPSPLPLPLSLSPVGASLRQDDHGRPGARTGQSGTRPGQAGPPRPAMPRRPPPAARPPAATLCPRPHVLIVLLRRRRGDRAVPAGRAAPSSPPREARPAPPLEAAGGRGYQPACRCAQRPAWRGAGGELEDGDGDAVNARAGGDRGVGRGGRRRQRRRRRRSASARAAGARPRSRPSATSTSAAPDPLPGPARARGLYHWWSWTWAFGSRIVHGSGERVGGRAGLRRRGRRSIRGPTRIPRCRRHTRRRAAVFQPWCVFVSLSSILCCQRPVARWRLRRSRTRPGRAPTER